jgi:hypothetical protein
MQNEEATTGLEVASVISQVKQAIFEAEKQVKDPAMLPIASLALTLKTIAETDAGGELKITIPIINTGFDFGVSLKQQETQTVVITLQPPPKGAAAEAIFKTAETIQERLVKAIVTIRDAVQAASVGEPRLVLDQATVTLNFVVSKGGQFEIVLKGSHNIEVTNSLELKLGKPKSGAPSSART